VVIRLFQLSLIICRPDVVSFDRNEEFLKEYSHTNPLVYFNYLFRSYLDEDPSSNVGRVNNIILNYVA